MIHRHFDYANGAQTNAGAAVKKSGVGACHHVVDARCRIAVVQLGEPRCMDRQDVDGGRRRHGCAVVRIRARKAFVQVGDAVLIGVG